MGTANICEVPCCSSSIWTFPVRKNTLPQPRTTLLHLAVLLRVGLKNNKAYNPSEQFPKLPVVWDSHNNVSVVAVVPGTLRSWFWDSHKISWEHIHRRATFRQYDQGKCTGAGSSTLGFNLPFKVSKALQQLLSTSDCLYFLPPLSLLQMKVSFFTDVPKTPSEMLTPTVLSGMSLLVAHHHQYITRWSNLQSQEEREKDSSIPCLPQVFPFLYSAHVYIYVCVYTHMYVCAYTTCI